MVYDMMYQCVWVIIYTHICIKITELQNLRMAEVRKTIQPIQRCWSKQDQIKYIAQRCIQLGLTCLQGWGLHHLWATCVSVPTCSQKNPKYSLFMLRRNSSYFNLCPFYLVFSFEKYLILPSVLPPIRLLFTLIRSPQRLLKAKQSHLCQALFILQGLQCPVMQYMKLPPLNYVFSMFASWSVYTEFLRPQSHRQVNQPDLTLATF